MNPFLNTLVCLFLITSALAAEPNPRPQANSATPPRNRRPTSTGEQIGENKATPIGRIKVAKDFKVELLYSVPGGEQGSWVNLCADARGRIYASDQYGGLYRFTPPREGEVLRSQDISKVRVDVRAINGMVFAHGALYVGVNDYARKFQSGLYRITDSDGDDQLDRAELLRAIDSGGDHGVHAVMPTPDGKGLYLVTGNNARLTETASSSPVPRHWGDDHLLPRMPDGRGHNRNVLAPGGIIYRVSPDGGTFEIFASGFRNVFDAAVNRDGELFTYDADMEYDFNTPWYRPTRINHVVSGAEFGWRNGTGKYPEFYEDNLPSTLNIGPGSPTGVTFGYGAKFPARYQDALFALDWSWGKLYAIHLQEKGSSYTATREEFLSGSPLPLTDAIIHPQDGSLYFAIGGRRVQSGLYRVTYTGAESTARVDRDPIVTEARLKRHQLEALHGKIDQQTVAKAWPHLGDPDRFIRWAARIAVEHQPVTEWSERALREPDPAKQVEALLALARSAGVCPSHRDENTAPVNVELRDKILAALMKLDLAGLGLEPQLTALRTIEITLNRFGQSDAAVPGLIAKLDPLFPAVTREQNWLLCEILCYLQAPNAAAKGMALIAAAPTQEEQMEYARSLRMLKTGWTAETRTAQLEWFLRAASYKGGASFDRFIEFIRTDALNTFSDSEKTQFAELIARRGERKSALENFGAVFAGRNPTEWNLEQLSAAAQTGLKGRDFANGRKMFGAAACFACHRFGNEGGMTGPDLTGAGGRFSPHDLLDQIINPSKVLNEQFVPIVVTTTDGDEYTGSVVNLNGDGVTLNTDASDPNQRVTIDRKKVTSIEPGKTSPMPPMLLSLLTQEEILDLLAYVLSGGDRNNPVYQP
ncbi:MAG: c-type cytochrome [Verrucomicrobia bacterium]|nr:c-type cytochrome [Verrucomicrobiota bacterium]